jgi:hypothetical protein
MFNITIPDWTSLEEKQIVETFPKRPDAIAFAKEVFGADSKGRIETVYESTEQPATKVRIVLHGGGTPYALRDEASGRIYLPWAPFDDEKDFTLRDTANRLLRQLVKREVHAKTLMNCGTRAGYRVYNLKVDPNELRQFSGLSFNRLAKKEGLKDLTAGEQEAIKNLGVF